MKSLEMAFEDELDVVVEAVEAVMPVVGARVEVSKGIF